MDKKVLLSALVIVSMMVGYNGCYAANTKSAEAETRPAIKVEKSTTLPLHKDKMTPPEFSGEYPHFGHRGSGEFMPPKPSKAEMEAKKAEIDKRLGLTDVQKKKLEKIKNNDREKIKPVIEKINADDAELHKIYRNNTLTEEQKSKKAEKIKKDIAKNRIQADKYRMQNMKNFESVLTKEQKTEFEKIKQEQKADMEKRKVEFEKKHKEFIEKYPDYGKKPEFGKRPPIKPLPIPDVKK